MCRAFSLANLKSITIAVGQFQLQDGRTALLLQNQNPDFVIWPTLHFIGADNRGHAPCSPEQTCACLSLLRLRADSACSNVLMLRMCLQLLLFRVGGRPDHGRGGAVS